MTTHQVLVAAKNYLLTHGWHQGWIGDIDAGTGPRCMIGATFIGIGPGESSKRACEAAEALGFDSAGHAAAWNDTDGRTLAEVVDRLDAAILATAPKDVPEPSPSVTHVFA